MLSSKASEVRLGYLFFFADLTVTVTHSPSPQITPPHPTKLPMEVIMSGRGHKLQAGVYPRLYIYTYIN